MKIKSIRPITAAHLDRVPQGEGQKTCLRTLRAPLLAAFDIYKSNVQYGILQETEEEHAAVLAWYRALLGLERWAVLEIPAPVARYVEGRP